MDGAVDRVTAQLERESWVWASQGRPATKRACEPFVRALLEQFGTQACDERVLAYTSDFCALVLKRKTSLSEIERMERAAGQSGTEGGIGA